MRYKSTFYLLTGTSEAFTITHRTQHKHLQISHRW